MALIICKECGKEVSDKADKCPHCGCPMKETKGVEQNIPKKKEKKKNSTLSVWAAVFGLFIITSFVGAILGIIDLIKNKNDGKKHIGSWFAIIMFALCVIANLGSGESDNNAQNSENISNVEQVIEEQKGSEEQEAIEETETETNDSNSGESQSDTENVLVGNSVDVNGLIITFNEEDTEFTDYEDEYKMYEPKEGMKYIMVSFTYENKGDSDKYVSIYDFNCYADNNTCEQAFLPDGSDFINTNLSSGRNVSFKTYYEVPVDSNKIELEYEKNIWTNEKIIFEIQ